MTPLFLTMQSDTLPMGGLLWGTLGVTIILFGIYSAILLWHWKEYSTGKFTTVANMLLYIGVGAGLLIIMAMSAAWYSLS